MKKKFEMSISESDKKLLIIFLAICLLAASYFFVFSKGMSKAQTEEQLAVECGYWNNFRYNPAAKAEGKDAFTLDSKAPTADYKEFIMGEARYSSLTRAFPERAEELFEKAAQNSRARYDHLVRLGELYAAK